MIEFTNNQWGGIGFLLFFAIILGTLSFYYWLSKKKEKKVLFLERDGVMIVAD